MTFPTLGESVLAGSVLIENDDIWGNHSVLDRVGFGQVFAETYACLPGEKLMVNVIAAEPTDVLFMNVGKMQREGLIRVDKNHFYLGGRQNSDMS